jgi:transcriptional regulator with XRE-family HTH domain
MVLLRHLLGDVLRRLRLRQGRTLREVSASARVSLGYLSEVERGQKEASSELLSAICTALDTPLSHVLREVSDNFALAELQNSPVLAGPREPVLSGAGAPAKPVRQVLSPPQDRVIGPVRLSPRRTPMRPDPSPLVPDDAAGLDHLTDTGDVSNMVPV